MGPKRMHWMILMIASLANAVMVSAGQRVTVIAHRGASGYLPEHTLAAKVMAHAQGADYIEQDVVLTKDDHPIVLHDIHLGTVTNVAQVFPGRCRHDQRFYAIDFTLAEIKLLKVNERIDLASNTAVYPHRFPVGQSHFHVPTLAEEIQLIQGLNKSTGRDVGIYLEAKSPAWHRQQGKDASKIILEVLDRFGYREKDDGAIMQSFDAAEIRRLREELRTRLTLVQLIGENDWNESSTDFEQLRTQEGIRRVAEHADGIGPWLPHVISGVDDRGKPIITKLVDWAHQQGLFVHPYTFRADSLPEYVNSFDQLLDLFVHQAKVDGVFTDFPDRAVAFLAR